MAPKHLSGGKISAAVISECQQYRYMLSREWNFPVQAYCNFIMLNPSTADHNKDDATIRRCVCFAKDWGYDGLYVTNLFAYRASDPLSMKKAADPVGPRNDYYLRRYAKKSAIHILAWGAHGGFNSRNGYVISILRRLGGTVVDLRCLGLTKGKHPRHPLYVAKSMKPKLWY